jgi:hypothetical protein
LRKAVCLLLGSYGGGTAEGQVKLFGHIGEQYELNEVISTKTIEPGPKVLRIAQISSKQVENTQISQFGGNPAFRFGSMGADPSNLLD